MNRYIARAILSIIYLTILVISIGCININMPGTPAENKTPQGDQAAPPVAVELPTIESFSAAPASVLAGKSSTLSWSVKNANAIAITPGIGTVSATGSQTVTPSTGTTYTLVASNAAGMQSKVVVVNILMVRKQSDLVPVAELPTIDSFSAAPASVLAGKSSTLSWSVKNANAVTITPGIGTVSATGSQTVTPSAATTYTLVASSAAGMQSKAVVVNILTVRKQVDIVVIETKKPDLTISESPIIYAEGSPYPYLGYKVRNIGAVDSNGCRMQLRIDGITKEAVLVEPKPPDGKQYEIYVPYKLTPTQEPHTFEAIIDADNWVDESDETNNSKIVQLNYQ